MSVVGTVESVWRYPVKSMRGEELGEAVLGFAGVYGDRLFAVMSTARPKGFPWLTAREQREMLRHIPRFRHPEKAAQPPNLAEAEGFEPGVTPVVADAADLAVDVETPSGVVFAVDDPRLLGGLQERGRDGQRLELMRSERGLADCRPVSLFSLQTARQLGEELGMALDKRRFRANVYLDLSSADGFAEDAFVGRTLRIGSRVTLAILERNSRCAIISMDPETAEPEPAVLKKVTAAHGGFAGVYGAVLVEGRIRPGDEIELLP
jgi:uncharacterized protein YcbX